jgi:nucleotide-binding universal stress UspA family protein
MRILLATDGSEYSEAAVDEIAGRPFPKGSEILLLSAFELPTFPIAVPWAGVDFDDEIQKQAQARARKAVKTAERKLRQGKEGAKLKVSTKVVGGSPKQAILDEAEAFKADLIVLGSHGGGRIERFLLGSVSLAVVTHAKCSVEIVRRPSA